MTCVALLRGINVAGNRPLAMADLRTLCVGLGCTDVRTYVQSGNVVCGAQPDGPGDLATRLAAAIADRWGYDVPVVVRTHAELKDVLAQCPFGTADPQTDGAKILVAFLPAVPAPDRVAAVLERVQPPERMVVCGREVYLHCPGGYGRCKLNTTLLEKEFGVDTTARNWKTLSRLVAMSA